METLTGIGHYSYSTDEQQTVFYKFKIEAKILNGNFEGKVIEEEFTNATGDTVHIKGFIEKKFISFVFRYNQYMPFTKRKKIKKSKEFNVLCNFIRRNFDCYDF